MTGWRPSADWRPAPVKWAPESMTIVPADRPRDPLAPILAELAEFPGRWAELDRYPSDRVKSARSRGANIKKRNPGIEYAVEHLGRGEVALYLRQEPAVETVDTSVCRIPACGCDGTQGAHP